MNFTFRMTDAESDTGWLDADQDKAGEGTAAIRQLFEDFPAPLDHVDLYFVNPADPEHVVLVSVKKKEQ